MVDQVKLNRRRGFTRVSAKNQVTLPLDALRQAGIGEGDTLRAVVQAPGQVLLVREEDPIRRFAGALTGVYARGELDRLRDEWE
jgi:bifunctional DNA-binding transcriptional regulator/antitoxin component of YhaV-PrlF toxin-antitoxin module